MKTKLFINNLEIFANHGLFEEENKLGQKFIFDIECELNYKKALFSDEMTDSISYADIADVVVKTATINTFNLLERLVGEILKNIFNEFPQIEKIKLTVNKPAAPISYHFEQCGVKVEITREEFYKL
jgi:hypothetical protein